jgi:prepilin-type N-terminal cleavage/methylation domain-containing protein/prepilin-type processing-associated H-X9-DG protein
MARNRSPISRGFTLIELLMTISVIGMLLAMLLPAVQQAWESGRANTCRNNLKNCTLAVTNFAAARTTYPGFRDPLEVSLPNGSGPAIAVQIPVGWVVQILPYIERTDVYDLCRNPQQALSAGIDWLPQLRLGVLNCPSSPLSDTVKSPCVYVANSGISDSFPIGTTASVSPFPADFQANGMFFNHYLQRPGTAAPASFVFLPSLPPLIFTTQNYVTTHDGSSQTLMLSENNNVPIYAPSGVPPPGMTGGPGPWGDPATSGSERDTCFIWWPDKNPSEAMRINAVPSTPNAPNYYFYFVHPAGNHPGGVNVSFCDGHVRFMSEAIDYFVYCLLMTPYGAQCNTPGTVNGLDGAGGTPWNLSFPQFYHPGGDNYLYLRNAIIDDAQVP